MLGSGHILNMLPDFPQIKARSVELALFRFKQEVSQDGILGQIRSMAFFEGTDFKASDVDGYEDQFQLKLLSTPIEMNHQELLERGIMAFIDALKRTVEPQRDAMKQMLFQRATEAIERVDNKVDANGKPLSGDLFLELLERMEIGFDEEGKPEMGTLVIHPSQAEEWKRLEAQLIADPEFQRKYGELMLRKRDFWRDRESNRKLVD
jgi:hypothetical protein